MKPAEKNPRNEVASPPDPERREFLRAGAALLAGMAVGPLASCSNHPSETAEPHTLFQNRPLRVGSTTITLVSCAYGKEFPSAHLNLQKDGGSTSGRVSMIVPSSFEFEEGGFEYELYVESVSCSRPNSANAILMKKETLAQDDGKRHPETADLFTIGAAAAFVGSIFLAIFERKSRLPDDGIVLPPKRNH